MYHVSDDRALKRNVLSGDKLDSLLPDETAQEGRYGGQARAGAADAGRSRIRVSKGYACQHLEAEDSRLANAVA